MIFNDIPRFDTLDASYGKAFFAFNSEFDTFGNGTPTTEQEKRAEAVQEKLMARYRNWPRSREGGAFSDTRLCVLPNTVLTTDGKVFAVCQIEFSANDNEFTGGLRTYTNVTTGETHQVQEHQGYDDETLRGRLGEFLLMPPDAVRLALDTHSKTYHVIFVICDEGHLDELFAYIARLDERFKGEFDDLEKSHEWIG